MSLEAADAPDIALHAAEHDPAMPSTLPGPKLRPLLAEQGQGCVRPA